MRLCHLSKLSDLSGIVHEEVFDEIVEDGDEDI